MGIGSPAAPATSARSLQACGRTSITVECCPIYRSRHSDRMTRICKHAHVQGVKKCYPNVTSIMVNGWHERAAQVLASRNQSCQRNCPSATLEDSVWLSG